MEQQTFTDSNPMNQLDNKLELYLQSKGYGSRSPVSLHGKLVYIRYTKWFVQGLRVKHQFTIAK